MEGYKERIQKLKDDLMYSPVQSDDANLIKVIQLKDISDDVRETLILLHSNYKTDLKELELKLNRYITESTNINVAAIDEFEKKIQNEEDRLNRKFYLLNLFLKLGTVEKVLFISMLFVVLLFVLHMISPNTFKGAIWSIKEILTATGSATNIS